MRAARRCAGLVLALGLSGAAQAETPLSAAEVLEAVDARIPKLAAARWSIEEKEAKLLASRSSFDPTLTAKATVEDQDPYAWTVTDEALSLALPFGPQLSVGHRMGVGKIPDYYGEYATADLGELRVSATLPLLQDLGMSPERAARLVAETEAEGARAKARQAEVEIAGKAALSWAKWVASGEKLRLAQSLVELAQSRQQALTRQVDEGALARIHLLDNERALAERLGEAAQARQDLEVAALGLSLWFRDADFQPQRPDPSRLPPPRADLPPDLG